MSLLSSLVPPQIKAYAAAAKVITVIAAAVALSVFSYNAGSRHTRLSYEAQIAKDNLAHAAELANEQSAYIALKDKYEKDTSEVEVEYYNALSELNTLKSKPVVVNRLYDPGAKRASCKPSGSGQQESSGVPGDGSGDSEGELSAEAERFLQEEASRADLEIEKCNLFRVKAHKWAKNACN